MPHRALLLRGVQRNFHFLPKICLSSQVSLSLGRFVLLPIGSMSEIGISRQYWLYVKQNGSLGSLTLHFCKKSLHTERQPVLNDADRHPMQIHPGRDLEGIRT